MYCAGVLCITISSFGMIPNATQIIYVNNNAKPIKSPADRLMDLIRTRDIDTIKIFLQDYPKLVNTRDDITGFTPLAVAIEKHDINWCNHLLQAKASPKFTIEYYPERKNSKGKEPVYNTLTFIARVYADIWKNFDVPPHYRHKLTSRYFLESKENRENLRKFFVQISNNTLSYSKLDNSEGSLNLLILYAEMQDLLNAKPSSCSSRFNFIK